MSKKKTIRKLRAKNKKLLGWCYDWKDQNEAREKVTKMFVEHSANLWYFIELQKIKGRRTKGSR